MARHAAALGLPGQRWACNGCGEAAVWHPPAEGGYYCECDCRARHRAGLAFIGYEDCWRCKRPHPVDLVKPQLGECDCLRCGRCRGLHIGRDDERDHPKFGGCENVPLCEKLQTSAPPESDTRSDAT